MKDYRVNDAASNGAAGSSSGVVAMRWFSL